MRRPSLARIAAKLGLIFPASTALDGKGRVTEPRCARCSQTKAVYCGD